MTGIVKYRHRRSGTCAIEVQPDRFVIFEDFEQSCSIGDILHGDLENLGRKTLYNLTAKQDVEGLVADII